MTDRIYWLLRLVITGLNQYVDSSQNLLISKNSWSRKVEHIIPDNTDFPYVFI